MHRAGGGSSSASASASTSGAGKRGGGGGGGGGGGSRPPFKRRRFDDDDDDDDDDEIEEDFEEEEEVEPEMLEDQDEELEDAAVAAAAAGFETKHPSDKASRISTVSSSSLSSSSNWARLTRIHPDLNAPNWQRNGIAIHNENHAEWNRPPLPPINELNDKITFMQIEVDYYKGQPMAGMPGAQKGIVPIIRFFGVTAEGNSVLAHVHGFVPYIYIEAPPNFTKGDLSTLRDVLNRKITEQRKKPEDGGEYVLAVEIIQSTSIMHYRGGETRDFIKIYTQIPAYVPPLRKTLEQGIELPRIGFRSYLTYESDVLFALRCTIDAEIVGCNWLEIPAGKYKIRPMPGPSISPGYRPKTSHCQLELDVSHEDVISHQPDESVEWLRMAPLRILSFDIECAGRKGHFPEAKQDSVIQIANYVTIHGQNKPIVKNVFTLNTCSNIVGAEVISFKNEGTMLECWRDFVAACDPDILTGYNINNFDLPYLINRAEALKLNRFKYLGRIVETKTRMRESTFQSRQYGKSENKDITIEGRVQMDVILAIRRDHKLSSYSLNSVSTHFLGEQKEDVHHSIITDLQNGDDETRRRLAVYCLKDAYLPQRLLDKLMIVVNLAEMSRVSGVNMGMLLMRGQQIKVISQLLRKSRKRNLLLPTQKIKIDVENAASFAGGAVLQPRKGFYEHPIATLDFASLYPSIMMAHNLCYSTLVRPSEVAKLPPDSYERTPSGAVFVKKSTFVGILPEILEELLRARKKARTEMEKATDPLVKTVLNGRQLALKVSANCFPVGDHEVLTERGFMSYSAVQKHFQTHESLKIACYVDGKMEFHPIGVDRVIVGDVDNNLVRFQSTSKSRSNCPNGVSLLVTGNHRMWARLGPTWSNRNWPHKPDQSQEDAAPEFGIHTAESVLAAGRGDPSIVVQFKTAFENGLVPTETDQPPFAQALGLSTDGQIDAFIELYGYWLAAGWPDPSSKTIAFSPLKGKDSAWLQDRFDLLALPRLTEETFGPGVHGVYIAPTPSKLKRKRYERVQYHRIYSPAWWTYFSEQYEYPSVASVLASVLATFAGDADHCTTVATSPPSDEDIKSVKRFWPWVFTHLDKRRSRLLIAGISKGNGEDRVVGATFSTSSVRFREELVRIGLAAGYSICITAHAVVHKNSLGISFVQAWKVNFTDFVREAQPKLAVPSECGTERYAGKVWCVTVPTQQQLIMVRRVVEDEAGVLVPQRPVIVCNSVYGFTGATVGRLPCLEISMTVTAFGREMIANTKNRVESHYSVQNGFERDAVVIYGDTDSVMVNFGTESLAEAMKLGREAAEFVTKDLFKDCPPIKLEFEKVYYPYLLISKKRYAGLLWTDTTKYTKLDTKGIETVRRDNCPLLKNIVGNVLNKILIDKNIEDAKGYVKQVISDLLMNRLDISLLVITKQLTRESEDYSVKQAHVELAARMRKRDPGSAPNIGDRVAYVVIESAKGAPAYEKSEDPIYVLENNIPIDTKFYLEHQLEKPIQRIFGPIMKDPRSLLRGEHTRSIAKPTPSVQLGGIMKFAKKTHTCLGCKSALPDSSSALCQFCKSKEPEIHQKLLDQVNHYQSLFSQTWTECQRCQGSLHQDILCTSRDCPIFYMRTKVQKDLGEIQEKLDRLSIADMDLDW